MVETFGFSEVRNHILGDLEHRSVPERTKNLAYEEHANRGHSLVNEPNSNSNISLATLWLFRARNLYVTKCMYSNTGYLAYRSYIDKTEKTFVVKTFVSLLNQTFTLVDDEFTLAERGSS